MRKRAHRKEEVPLTRRERQLMDILHRRGSATAREVWEELPEAPSYSTVRTLLTLLVTKGQARQEASGKAHRYTPATPRTEAAASALRRVVRTFFAGSVANAVSSLLSLEAQPLDPDELQRLQSLLNQDQTRRPS